MVREMGKKNKFQEDKKSQADINLEMGLNRLNCNALFSEMSINWYIGKCTGDNLGNKNCPAIVRSDDRVYVNKEYLLEPTEWEYTMAHCLLHLAFGHFNPEKIPSCVDKKIWNYACDIYIAKFLADVKIGKPIYDSITNYNGPLSDEINIYEYLLDHHEIVDKNYFGVAAKFQNDMIGGMNTSDKIAKEFAYALAKSVTKTVVKAGGHSFDEGEKTRSMKAAEWFINHYPLLGGLASGFKIIEDRDHCYKNDIQIAAVDVTKAEIYVNPTSHLEFEELKFVLAHEFLHAGLQHAERCQGRDRYLWNVACDYVINGWLYEMGVGEMPDGILYDENLKNQSAEEIYDDLVQNLKKNSKLNTLRGYGLGDIMGEPEKNKNQVSLDEFYRSALQNGLEYYNNNGRGFIPAGLIEEIRALAMPPIPWDVELGKWFDMYFAPLEARRSYARPSRRQGSTPDIPRPRYIPADIPENSRTFGVVIDTSGSMSAKMIGYALGAIASYSDSKDVPCARVIFCDAAAYDAGYLSPEDIAGRVEVKGRGGTILQPGVDKLIEAKDFPKDAPILIITDGYIENNLQIKRDHAFLIPRGHHLPFRAKGKVFYFSEN